MPSWKLTNRASITNQPAWTVGGLGPTVGKGPFIVRAIQINANGQGPFRFRTFCQNQLGNIGGGRSNSMFGPSADGTNGCKNQPCVIKPYCINRNPEPIVGGWLTINPELIVDEWPDKFPVNSFSNVDLMSNKYCDIYRNLLSYPCDMLKFLGLIPNKNPSYSVDKKNRELGREGLVPPEKFEFTGYISRDGYKVLNPIGSIIPSNIPTNKSSIYPKTINLPNKKTNTIIKDLEIAAVGFITLVSRWILVIKLPDEFINCNSEILPIQDGESACVDEILGIGNFSLHFQNLATNYNKILTPGSIETHHVSKESWGSLLLGKGHTIFSINPSNLNNDENNRQKVNFTPDWVEVTNGVPIQDPPTNPPTNTSYPKYVPYGSPKMSSEEKDFIDAVTSPYSVNLIINGS